MKCEVLVKHPNGEYGPMIFDDVDTYTVSDRLILHLFHRKSSVPTTSFNRGTWCRVVMIEDAK
jgi:hypothetical protein